MSSYICLKHGGHISDQSDILPTDKLSNARFESQL